MVKLLLSVFFLSFPFLGCSSLPNNSKDSVISRDIAAEKTYPDGCPINTPLDGTGLYEGMPVNEAMCSQMLGMPCCKEYQEKKLSMRRKRKRIDPDKLAPFPAKAPGIESYENHGYCSGTLRTEMRQSQEIKIRHYEMVADDSKGYFQLHVKKTDGGICPPLSKPNAETRRRPLNAAPLLFKEGEVAEIRVTNLGKEGTGIHWHGLELENSQDGVPGMTQELIAPNKSYTYRFPLLQNGTYWYHSHVGLQEQLSRGMFLIFPKDQDPIFRNRWVDTRYHHDRTILLTDYSHQKPREILAGLQTDSNNMEIKGGIHHNFAMNGGRGLKCGLENMISMGMPFMDKADIYYDDFYMNDETCLNCGPGGEGEVSQSQKEFARIKAGERVRLRIQNGSASSYFFVDYANNKSLDDGDKLPMVIVAKDGKNVQPLEVDQLLLGMGESYDVILEVPEANTGYELRLKSIDDENNKRPAKLYIGDYNVSKKTVKARDVPINVCSDMAPENYIQVGYDMLKTAVPDPIDDSIPVKNYEFELLGNMENYYWQIKGVNGTRLEYMDHGGHGGMPVVRIPRNTRIHVTVHNSMIMGMMNHPMHLHGQFFKLIKKEDSPEQASERAWMHTATVYPGGDLELEFYSGPKGIWMFHCHNLYHMANAMMLAFMTEDAELPPHSHHAEDGVSAFLQQNATVQGQFGGGPAAQSASVTYIGSNGNSSMNRVELHIERMQKADHQIVEADGSFDYCYEPHKCVTLNLKYDQDKTAPGVGYSWKPSNNNVIKTNVQVYTDGVLKTSVGTSLPIADYTNLEAEVGCTGQFCKAFEASLGAAIRPSFNMRLYPIKCRYREAEGGLYCGAELQIITDPVPLK